MWDRIPNQMCPKFWVNLDLAPKFSELFFSRNKKLPSNLRFGEVHTQFSLISNLSACPDRVSFLYWVLHSPFSDQCFVCILCLSQRPQKPYKDVFVDFRDSYIKLWHVFPCAFNHGVWQSCEEIWLSLTETRNPGFDLSHSLLPPSCAEMFSNLWTSSQAVLTFDPETFGDLLIAIQPQAKTTPLFLDSLQ